MSSIFGREPIKVLAFLSALVSLASVTLTHWTDEQQGAVNAVIAAVVGVIGAFSVSEEKGLPLVAGLVQAVLALALAFGAHIDAGTNAAIMAFVAAAVGMWLRDRVVAPVDAAGNRV